MTAPDIHRPSTIRLIWELLKVTPLRYGLTLASFVLIWGMPVIPALLTKAFFDRLETGVGWNFDTLVVAMVAYGIARVSILLFGMFMDAHFMFRLGATMRTNLLERIYELPGADALDESPGQVISRFREDVDHAEEAAEWTVDIVGALVFGVIAAVVLLSIDPLVTIIVFAPVIVMITVSERLGSRIRRYRAEAREATGRITGMVGEMYSSVQSIKVAGAERSMIDHFVELNDRRRKLMVRDRVLTAMLESMFFNIVNIGIGVVLIVAANSMTAGTMSVGDFALFVYFLDFVTDAGFFVGLFVARVKQAGVSFDRMTETMRGADGIRVVGLRPLYLDGPEQPASRPVEATEPLQRLEVRGLTYHHPGTTVGIEDVDLTLDRGSFTVVTGRIGSGKTTLLRAILGLLEPQRGTIAWNGSKIAEPDDFFVPPRSSYVPQVPTLFSMTLRDNLLMGRDDSDTTIAEAVRAAAFERDLAAMPVGLDTMVGPLGMRLSGGQIQRTATARMFLRDTELLVIDDLSSALDVETERAVWERLFRDKAGTTALVVSHRRPALQRADQIVVLDHGRVIARGTWEELITSSDEVRTIFEASNGS